MRGVWKHVGFWNITETVNFSSRKSEAHFFFIWAILMLLILGLIMHMKKKLCKNKLKIFHIKFALSSKVIGFLTQQTGSVKS